MNLVPLDNDIESESHISRVREVTLLPNETISHFYSPEHGLVEEIPDAGRFLVTTNQRIISFSETHGRTETSLVHLDELKGIVLTDRAKSTVPFYKIIFLGLIAIVTYISAAYWLAGKIDGPNIPIIHLDFWPFALLLASFSGAFLVWKYYLVKVDSMVRFQIGNWTLTFPYQGAKAETDIHQVAYTLFGLREANVSPWFNWEE
jgi:hypothetical protein